MTPTETDDARARFEALTGWIARGESSPCIDVALYGRHGHPRDEWCPSAWSIGALDHVYRVDREGQRGVLAMPYDFADDKAEELTAWCRTRGLHWYCYGTGWWHPWTVALVLTVEP